MDRRDLVSIVGLSNLAEQSRPFQLTIRLELCLPDGYVHACFYDV